MKKWRANFIFILILLSGATIVGRLFFLQIIQHDFYKALAQGQQRVFQPMKGERGKVFFKGGQTLATNVERKYVFISPVEIKKKEETAKILSQTLELEEELILEKARKDSLFEELKINLTGEEYKELEEADLPGVYSSEATFREYPQGTMASHIIGFLGGENVGQYGIEGYYDDSLQGKESFQETERGFGKYFFKMNGELTKGDDIFLTVDYNIQFMAEKLLSEAKESLNIKGGQIIVINPNSGEIMALASFPSFDPNNYSEVEDLQIFQNPVVQKLFEPGSVFKPITMAGALDREKITPQTTYYDSGIVNIGTWSIYNYDERSYGEQTMTEVLEKSINTGAVFAERQLGNDLFLEYLEQFGFFESTEIDLQGEVFSENEEFKKGYEINFCTASFGQGIEITPIQLVRAFSAVANGGKLINPYVVSKIVRDGKIIEIQPKISRNVVSQRTASQLTAMLVSVIENGFSKKAGISGYYVAGKTGTAQVSWSALGVDKKGYSNETWQSFLGFVPALDPKFLVLVKLDSPWTRTAEYSAIPVFQKLAKYIINYLQIPPDHD